MSGGHDRQRKPKEMSLNVSHKIWLGLRLLWRYFSGILVFSNLMYFVWLLIEFHLLWSFSQKRSCRVKGLFTASAKKIPKKIKPSAQPRQPALVTSFRTLLIQLVAPQLSEIPMVGICFCRTNKASYESIHDWEMMCNYYLCFISL